MRRSGPVMRALAGAVIYDGYYTAILGYVQMPSGHNVLVYDRDRAVAELAKDFRADIVHSRATVGVVNAEPDDPDPATEQAYEEAEDFFSFNVEGGWLGPYTPLILSRMPGHGFDEFPTTCSPRVDEAWLKRWALGVASRCGDTIYVVLRPGVPRHADVLELVTPNDYDKAWLTMLTLKSTRSLRA